MGFWNNLFKTNTQTPDLPSAIDLELEDFHKTFPQDTPARIKGESTESYFKRVTDNMNTVEKKVALKKICLKWFEITSYDMKENHQRSELEFDKLKEKYFHQVKQFLPATLSSMDEREIYELIWSIPYTDTNNYLSRNFHKFFELTTGEKFAE